jgi:hypothetical protein
MIVIADNDIIHKLALCNLLEEFLAWLQVPPSEVWVLPTLKFWIRRKLKGNVAALSRFEKFLLLTAEIPVASPASLEFFDSLDVGEQQLLSVFIEQPEPPRLVTGDKRAIRQLAELSQQNILLSAKLEGQVDCLEGVMLELIRLYGFDTINSKIVPEADGLFRLVFGAGRTQEHANEALQSYLGELRRQSPFVISR